MQEFNNIYQMINSKKLYHFVVKRSTSEINHCQRNFDSGLVTHHTDPTSIRARNYIDAKQNCAHGILIIKLSVPGNEK